MWECAVHLQQKVLTKSISIDIDRVSCVSVLIATISMWIMWACTYMHQMNPLIEPILMVEKEG